MGDKWAPSTGDPLGWRTTGEKGLAVAFLGGKGPEETAIPLSPAEICWGEGWVNPTTVAFVTAQGLVTHGSRA